MIRSKFSATLPIETLALELGFRVLAVFELDAETAARRLAEDVVVGAADGAGPALHAVAEADQGLHLLLVPLVDAGRAEVVAVLARALVAADVLVGDFDVGVASVLDVLVREQLVGQLLHRRNQSIVEIRRRGSPPGLRGPPTSVGPTAEPDPGNAGVGRFHGHDCRSCAERGRVPPRGDPGYRCGARQRTPRPAPRAGFP